MMVRVPGELGPILRCRGDLTVRTMEALRRDLALLAGGGHRGVVLNLSGLRTLDADAVRALIESGREMAKRRSSLVLVAGSSPAAEVLDRSDAPLSLTICADEGDAATLLAASLPS